MSADSGTPSEKKRPRPRPAGSAVALAVVSGCVFLVGSVLVAVHIDPALPTTWSRDPLWPLTLWGVFLAGALVADYLHRVLHELGQLVAAVLLRLPVTGVKVRLWGSGHVQVNPGPSARLLRIRFIAFALTGPLVHIGLAAVTYRLAWLDPMAALPRCALLAATLSGFVLGIRSLAPVPTLRGTRSDGNRILGWIFRPAAERAALATQAPGTDLEVLRAQLDGDDPQAAQLGAKELLAARLSAGTEPDDADWDRLVRVARSPATHPVLAGAIASGLVWYRCLNVLSSVVSEQRPADEERVASIVDLAEFAVDVCPERATSPVALALVRILLRRPLAASELLRHIEPSAEPRADATVDCVRAIAALYLGDLTEAQRLTADMAPDAAATRIGQYTQWLLAEALRTGTAPQLVARIHASASAPSDR